MAVLPKQATAGTVNLPPMLSSRRGCFCARSKLEISTPARFTEYCRVTRNRTGLFRGQCGVAIGLPSNTASHYAIGAFGASAQQEAPFTTGRPQLWKSSRLQGSTLFSNNRGAKRIAKLAGIAHWHLGSHGPGQSAAHWWKASWEEGGRGVPCVLHSWKTRNTRGDSRISCIKSCEKGGDATALHSVQVRARGMG